MASICLLTDGSVQFSSTAFQGFEHIYILETGIKTGKDTAREVQEPLESSRFSQLPPPGLRIPEVQEICETIATFSQRYDTLIAILSAREVNPVFDVIQKAVMTSCGRIKGRVVDSKAVASGLGFLLETAAEAAVIGGHPDDVEHLVRSWIPHIYTTISTPDWPHLQRAGLVDHAQAASGEMLGLAPIFTLEEGGLSPVQKLKNDHSLFEPFQVFLDEFDDLERITFLHHDQVLKQEADFLSEHARSFFPGALYSEILINPTNAAVFGPRTSCLTVVEKISS